MSVPLTPSTDTRVDRGNRAMGRELLLGLSGYLFTCTANKPRFLLIGEQHLKILQVYTHHSIISDATEEGFPWHLAVSMGRGG